MERLRSPRARCGFYIYMYVLVVSSIVHVIKLLLLTATMARRERLNRWDEQLFRHDGRTTNTASFPHSTSKTLSQRYANALRIGTGFIRHSCTNTLSNVDTSPITCRCMCPASLTVHRLERESVARPFRPSPIDSAGLWNTTCPRSSRRFSEAESCVHVQIGNNIRFNNNILSVLCPT